MYKLKQMKLKGPFMPSGQEMDRAYSTAPTARTY